MPVGSYRLRGLYSRQGARQSFELCSGGPRFPVEPAMRPKLAEMLAHAATGGRPALLTLSGILTTPDAPGQPPQPGKTALTISAVISLQPGGSCADAPPARPGAEGAVTVPPLKPISEQRTQGETAAPLVETNWLLAELNGAPVTASERERAAALRFLAQARIGGSTGCNRFSGTYTIDGRALRFSPLTITRMVCPGGMNLEEGYLRALEATRQYELHGATLELNDDAGRNLARFHAATAAPRVTNARPPQ
jgi:heat shock protein HslJ